MKKTFAFLSLSIAAFACLSFLNKAATANMADYKDNYVADAPVPGEVDSGSYFVNSWFDSVGAKRISDRAVIATDISDWGRRGKFAKRYDIRDFSITLDLEKTMMNSITLLTFATADGTYVSESGKVLSFDFVRSTTKTDSFFVVASTKLGSTDEHAVSIDNFKNGTGYWEEDSHFTGVAVTAADQRITLSVKRDSDTLSTITVNGEAFSVNTSDLYKNVTGDNYDLYLTMGSMNGGGAYATFIVESIGDADDEVYYGSTGDYSITKAGLQEIMSLTIDSAEDAVEAKEKLDAIPYKNLYSFDKNYLSDLYTSASNKINQAIEQYGSDVLVPIYETAVNKLVEACKTLNTVSNIDAALSAKEECEDLYSQIDSESVSPSLVTRLEAAKSSFDTEIVKLIPAIKSVYETNLVAYEEAVNALTNAESIKEAMQLKSNVPSKYNSYLENSEAEAYATRISAATNKLNSATRLNNDKYDQGANAYTKVLNNGSIDLYTYGASMGASNAEGSGLFLKEKLDVLNFDVMINFTDMIPESTGAWVSFGLLEKPEMWIFADNESVQDNKGIFFLVSKINATKLNVQAHLMTMNCTRFYDAPLAQNIQIPMSEKIHVQFSTQIKSVAGTQLEYFNMSFNGVSFDQEAITSRKIKTALTDLKGHFFVCSNGYDYSNGACVNIETINGHVPSKNESFAKAEDLTPTTTDESKSFTQYTDKTVSFIFDNKGQDLTSVMVNDAELKASDYSFADSKLTLTNAYLRTLTVGAYKVKATTAHGSVTWDLFVQEGVAPSDGSNSGNEGGNKKKAGCKGSIAATGIILSAFALVGVGAIVLKKRKEDK